MGALAMTAAFFRRDWEVARSFRFPFLLEAVAVLSSCALFYYLGRSIGSTPREGDFFAFVVPGLVVLRLNASLPRAAVAREAELANGCAELLAASPLSSTLSMIAGAAFETVRSLVMALCVLGLAVGLFGAPLVISAGSLAALALGLSGAVVLFFSLNAALTSLVLTIRQAAALSSLIGLLLPVMCGAYFPARSLPQPLETIAQLLPFRAAVDVMRQGLLHGTLALGSLAELWLPTLVAVWAGLTLLRLATIRARREGTLNHA